MADTKISALTASTTPLAGTEVLPIVQSGTTKKVSVDNLTAGRVVSASGVAVNATFKSWSVVNAMQVGTGASFGGGVGFADGFATCNSYYDGSNWKRITATGASQIALTPSTGIKFNIAGTGTADSNMTWTEAGSFSELADFTVNNGNVVIGTSGKGIDFSATPGTGTSELLADYEEGTWTPSDTSGAGLTLTITGTSTYTKIGRQVIATADITYPITVDASLTLVGGLPFTSGAAPCGAGSIGYTDYGTWITASPSGAATAFRFIGATTFLTNAQLSGKRVQVCIAYIV